MAVKGEKEKLPACKLSTIINGQFLAVRMIGKGGYGVVYEIIRLNSPTTRLACKAELATAHNNLKTEWDLMKLLMDNKSKHNIIGVELGTERDFNYIIMHLVGPSLTDLRKCMPDKKFTLYTTTVCSIQCFDGLVEIQKQGYIHRDVKPSNFAIGTLGSEEEKLIYVLDFGFCRNIFKNKELRKPRMNAPFRGTVSYCSLNIHSRMEAGRHDDFLSLVYMMIEFYLGDLPWEKMEKEDVKKAKEKATDGLLKKCPSEFKLLRQYLQTLTYSHEPDYVLIRAILCQMMHVNKFSADKPLDWQTGGKDETVFKPRTKALSGRKTNRKRVLLKDLLNIPKRRSKLISEKDFPPPVEVPKDESVSKSDDTIADKEGPAPAPRPPPRPFASQATHKRLSAEVRRRFSGELQFKRLSNENQRENQPTTPPPPTPIKPSVPRPSKQSSTPSNSKESGGATQRISRPSTSKEKGGVPGVRQPPAPLSPVKDSPPEQSPIRKNESVT